MTTAFLNCWGKTPSTKDKLSSFGIDGSKISTQSLRRKVNTGSKRNDLVGEFLIIFNTSFSETSQKCDRWGGKSVRGATVVVDAKNVSQILLIFLSEKRGKLISQGFVRLVRSKSHLATLIKKLW